jgi:hypothetical protein
MPAAGFTRQHHVSMLCAIEEEEEEEEEFS